MSHFRFHATSLCTAEQESPVGECPIPEQSVQTRGAVILAGRTIRTGFQIGALS
jgi:hypothetical protein